MTDQTIIPPARPHRSTMIKNLMPRLPERGHVKIGALGEKRTARSGREYAMPTKLDHFRITTLQRGLDGNFMIDKEVHDLFGERPTEIPIRLLYDQVDLNFSTRYAVYSGRTLWCSGDGESALRVSKDPADKHPLPEPFTVQCPCHRQAPGYVGADKCKPNGRLSFLIDGVGGIGGVFVFRTTSFNSVTGILSSLAFLRSITGGILANIPLRLRIQPKQATNPSDQSSVLIYVVSIEFAGPLSELQHHAHQIALDRATTHMSITHIEEEARRLLELPGPANSILPGDDPEDVRAEFYPETNEDAQAGIPAAAVPARPTREQFASPQAPLPAEREADPEPQPLSEAEEAELAALIVKGDAAAAEGTEAFTAFWNAPDTKPYRKELTPRLDAWSVIAKREVPAEPTQDEIYPYEIYDVTGVAVEKMELDAAVGAYRAFLLEGERHQGESGLTTVWDNNQGLMQQLDERGHPDISKELSREYGEARQAAAARAQANAEREAKAAADAKATDGIPRGTETEVRGPSAADHPERASVAGAAQGAPSATPAPAATGGAGTIDLLGGTPAEDLTIQLTGKKLADFEYFARQLAALIAEAPGTDTNRLTRIRLANERGLAALKAGAPALYEQAMAALYRKP